MGQIMGKSMRFVITVPLATGRELILMAKDVGMAEYAFTSASLIIGAKSLSKSNEMMKRLTEAQAMKLADMAIKYGEISAGRKGRKGAKVLPRKGKEK